MNIIRALGLSLSTEFQGVPIFLQKFTKESISANTIHILVNNKYDYFQTKLKLVTVLGAGLLVGTALAVIIPEGVHALLIPPENG